MEAQRGRMTGLSRAASEGGREHCIVGASVWPFFSSLAYQSSLPCVPVKTGRTAQPYLDGLSFFPKSSPRTYGVLCFIALF